MSTHRTVAKLPISLIPKLNRVQGIIMGVAVLLILSAVGLLWLAQSRTNHVALSSKPKPVSVVLARSTTFRPSRRYIGTLEAWVSSNIGPQIISAYIDTVLVRPGAKVKRGSVLATLDCRNASAASRAVAAQARAIEAKQKALSHEAARTRGLLDGGFVSPNEAEQKSAQSSAEEAQLAAELERVAKTTLEVSDCVLRAPFDGEVATRSMDPGAYARPGSTIVTVVDRNTVRMRADVPESDFDFVSPGVEANVLVFATGQSISLIQNAVFLWEQRARYRSTLAKATLPLRFRLMRPILKEVAQR